MTRKRERNTNPWWRRLHHAWQALTGHERFKSNATSFVEFGGQRYKQVRFPDTAEARRVEQILRQTRTLGLFPDFVFRLESTLWVRFVPGVPLDTGKPDHVSGIGAFFAGLYRHRTQRVDTATTDLHQRLFDNLRVLEEVGGLSGEKVRALTALAEKIRPERVWMGLEYIDPLRKNFVLAAHGVVGIDIEAIQDKQLLGIGLAKARVRWLDQPAAEILESLAARGGPDLKDQYDYAHLYFLAHYGVQNLFRGKPGRLGPEAFEALLFRSGVVADQ